MKKISLIATVTVYTLLSLYAFTTTRRTRTSIIIFPFFEVEVNESTFVKEHTQPIYKAYPRDINARRKLLEEAVGKQNIQNGTLKYPSIRIKKYGRLGNNILQLSNAIFLSEAMNTSTIYINKGFCFIHNNITTSKGIKIIPTGKAPKETVTLYSELFGLKAKGHFPETRGYEFGNESLKDIPRIETDDEALYIHVRSGDVFKDNPNKYYGQPPLCYYESIINIWGFKDVYVIAEDTKNPVIDALIKKYNVTHINTTVPETIGYILSAKNVAISSGSFVPSILRLAPDDPSKKIFKYGGSFGINADIWRKFYFTTTSKYYCDHILGNHWNNTKEQYEIMLNESCGNEWYSHHTHLET